MKKAMTINIEPKWEDICREAIHLSNDKAVKGVIECLIPACKIADTVRQAQKNGAKSVKFSFSGKTGSAKIEVTK